LYSYYLNHEQHFRVNCCVQNANFSTNTTLFCRGLVKSFLYNN